MRRFVVPAAITCLLAGALLSFMCHERDEPVPTSGGWFCCDLAGNCVYITSQNTQDCKTTSTVKWCKKVSTNADGSKVCSEWGE
jgi:hypothetical protein